MLAKVSDMGKLYFVKRVGKYNFPMGRVPTKYIVKSDFGHPQKGRGSNNRGYYQ